MARSGADRPPGCLPLVAAALLVITTLAGCAADGDSGVTGETDAKAGSRDAPGTPVATSTPSGSPTARPLAPVDKCWGRRPTIVGTSGDDTVTATRKRDVIVTLAGDDRISGLRGEDKVCAGDGNDTAEDVRGGAWLGMGAGSDVVRAQSLTAAVLGPGDDRLHVSGYFSKVVPGPGDDIVVAAKPKPHRYPNENPCVNLWTSPRPLRVDLAAGTVRGEGRDRLRNIVCVVGSRYDDVVLGTAGRDSVEAGLGADLVRTGGGDDLVMGSGGDDRVYTGDGADYANGENGNDRLYGESGNDRLEGWYGADYLDGSIGDDEVYAGISCEISGNSYGTGGTMDDEPNEVFGGPGSDYVTGDLGNDRVDGGPGHDIGQGGYRDGHADWLESIEGLLTGCAEGYSEY